MSNVQKYKVMTWEPRAQRYFHEYDTEFGDHIHPNEVRLEVLRCDPGLPDGKLPSGACETIVVRDGGFEDRARTEAAYDATIGHDLDDEGFSFHDYS
jgi:hypothetical protein